MFIFVCEHEIYERFPNAERTLLSKRKKLERRIHFTSLKNEDDNFNRLPFICIVAFVLFRTVAFLNYSRAYLYR